MLTNLALVSSSPLSLSPLFEPSYSYPFLSGPRSKDSTTDADGTTDGTQLQMVEDTAAGAGEPLPPLALAVPLDRAFLLLSFPFRAALRGFYNNADGTADAYGTQLQMVEDTAAGAGELLSPLALPLVRAFLLLSFPFRAALQGFCSHH